MKTLVIHIEDPTTDFLSHIYKDIDNIEIIRDPFISDDEIFFIMPEYSRVMCLGHGSPLGLFGWGGYAISDIHASIMSRKDLVCVWCNADVFMKENHLKGFYSGMFISETVEASCFGIDATEKQIEDSNILFANLLGKYIDDKDRLVKIKNEYRLPNNLVVNFNRERLYDTV